MSVVALVIAPTLAVIHGTQDETALLDVPAIEQSITADQAQVMEADAVLTDEAMTEAEEAVSTETPAVAIDAEVLEDAAIGNQ